MVHHGNLRIKRQYSLIGHGPDMAELRCGVWNPKSFTLTDEGASGRLYGLLTRIDGSLSPAELAKAEGVPQAEVEALLDHLIELDVVESGPSTSLDYYLDQVVPTLRPPNGSTAEPLPVVLLGPADLTDEVRRFLEAATGEGMMTTAGREFSSLLEESDSSWLVDGIRFQRHAEIFSEWRGKFLIALAKVINPIRFRALNRICLEHRIPWIQGAVDGPFLFIGPIVVPHRSACYECFETRVMMNLREYGSYQRYKHAMAEGLVRVGEPPMEPVLVGLLASHVAMEALNFVLTRDSFTVGKVLAIYLPTMEMTFNEVLRVPGCPGCSPMLEREGKELYFDARALIAE